MTDQSTQTDQKRILRFSIANLSIQTEMRCGPFRLLPKFNDVQYVPDNEWSIQTVPSATGCLDLPAGPANIAVIETLNNDLRDLLLLLTFVNHSPSPLFDFVVQAPATGAATPALWLPGMYGEPVRSLAGPRNVEQRAETLLGPGWSALQRPEVAYEMKLKTALVYYAEAVGTGMADVRFLMGWMGFEALLQGTAHDSTILSTNKFKRIRRGLEQSLREMTGEYADESGLEAAVQKLPELNRWPLAHNAAQFFRAVLPHFSEVQLGLEVQEVVRLAGTRNKIAHTGGVLPWKGPSNRAAIDGYMDTMSKEWEALHALLNRSITALIGLGAQA